MFVISFRIAACARASVLALAVLCGACQEPTIVAPAPAPMVPSVPAPLEVALDCHVDVRAAAMGCAPTPGATPTRSPGTHAAVVIGGQNTYVTLASTSSVYDAGTNVLSSAVTVKNLLSQALGTTDGVTTDPGGVTIFFRSQPTVTSGTGIVTIRNADGTGTFTGAGQPYFSYHEIVWGQATSTARVWQFDVPSSASAFTFQVYVRASLRDESPAAVTQLPPHTFFGDQLGVYASTACAIRTGAGVYCWGYNNAGSLGAGLPTSSLSMRTDLPTLSPPLVTIVAGYASTCGLTSAGQAYCWGRNANGQLGDGTTVARARATAVAMPASVTFTSIVAGQSHTCALSAAGAAYCWGRNDQGTLGDSTVVQRLVPTAVRMPVGVVFSALAAGDSHTCGLATDGTVYCWGYNGNGQLGDGTTTRELAPTLVTMPTSTTFTALATGANHTCALASTGMAYCWGDNSNGQGGDGTLVQKLVPSASAMPNGVTFSSLTAGSIMTCALTPSGSPYCWGNNGSGQLGDGTTTRRTTPTAVIVPAGLVLSALSNELGGPRTCAVSTAHALYCWGVAPDNGTAYAATLVSTPPGRTYIATAVGGSHACALASDGTSYCWGSNSDGQLGNDYTTIAQALAPVLALGTRDVVALARGQEAGHVCGVTSGGGVLCWGYNSNGQLGDGTSFQRISPVPVTIPGNAAVTSIAVGMIHSCALTTAGAAYCWGDNSSRQLGDGTGTARRTPTAVTMPGGVTFTSIAAGEYHTCATASDGAAYCWGGNGYGSLGDGTTTLRSVPTRVTMPSSVSFTAITVGAYHSCALTSGGAVYCWGYNGDGEVGDNTPTQRLVPTAAVMPVGITFASVTAGYVHSCALSTAGRVYCWGNNNQSQFGDGTVVIRTVPTAVANGLTFTGLTAGEMNGCGLTSAGAAYCWGSGMPVGNGTNTQPRIPTAVLMP